ncbi:MAG: type II toxin-antitoxin system VapC family toxin [Chloroflexota bacterium]
MIAVDASVAAKWVLPEEYSDQALALIDDASSNGQPVVAPSFLPIEVTNIIRQQIRREGLTLDEGLDLLDRFLAFPVSLTQPADLHPRALNLAVQYRLPAVYDAHYVVLAEALGAIFWTNNQRLLHAVAGALPFVRWIVEYA